MIRLRLGELLEKRGRTFYWLAKETGLNQSVLHKLRYNKMKAIRIDVMEKLCAALECEPGELFEVVEGKRKK